MPKKRPAAKAKSKRPRPTGKAKAPVAKRVVAKRAAAKRVVVSKAAAKPASAKSTRPAPKPTAAPATPTPAVPTQNGSKKNGDLAEYRELLLTLRARVRGDVEQMTSEALDRNGDGTESKSPTHLAELGTETYEQDFALRRVENEQDLLDEIDEALARIAKGSYGLCVSCLESGITGTKAMIPRARLRVIPYARNCVECERKRERWGR